MKSRLLSLMAVGLISLGTSQLTACAHAVPRVPSGAVYRGGGSPGWWRDAYNRGYQDGRRQGERDARRGRWRDWRDRRWDRRDERWRAYEEGYRDGYRASFARYDRSGRWGYDPRYGRGPDGYGRAVPRYPGASRAYRSPAVSKGYEDGYKEGRDAARDGKRHDPIREKKYRSADSGYKGEYGPKDAYRAEYRSGFRRGYDVGYREAARRW